MSGAKVRKTLTLDPELIDAFGADDATFVVHRERDLRREVDRRQRLDALTKLLDRLEQERGPVDQTRWRSTVSC